MEGAGGAGAQVFIVLNPVGGTCDPETVRESLARRLGEARKRFAIYETTGAHDEDIAAKVRAALARGAQLVVAIGGDGTVSEVAGALAGSDVPLGIIPAGTANVLARELGVPVDLEAAAALLAGEHRVMPIDGMEVDGRIYVLGIGVGLESIMIRDTPRDAKRRFGRLAYVWTALTRALGFRGRRFTIVVDGRPTRPRAVQVLVANGGTLGIAPLRWGPGISPSDGRANVVVVGGRTPLDYLKIAWHAVRGRHRASPHLKYLTARESVTITTDPPLPVQADGEIIGSTPVHVRIVPSAVRVVAPAGAQLPAEPPLAERTAAA
ncbi:MAG TPA: diacylglycerol kinase family protein [Roseiflexaceae bacterium]|nr:diacylglycerol kinase family protein [Roseiflexaceae bacterium]